MAPLVLVAVVIAAGAGPRRAEPCRRARHVRRDDDRARPVALGMPSPFSVQAQSVISSTVGAGDTRFSPRRRPRGFQLVGGGVTAALGRGGTSVGGHGGRLTVGLLAIGRAGRRRQLTRSRASDALSSGGVRAWRRDARVVCSRTAGARAGIQARAATGGSLGGGDAGDGPRRAARAAGGSGVEFLARSGRVALRYGGLVARDARGRRLPAWLSLSGSRLLLGVNDRGARYPLRIDPLIQQGPKLTASDESGRRVRLTAWRCRPTGTRR